MEKQKDERMGLLDILKGVMILFVIITHYRWNYPEDYLKYGFVFYIDMAVPIFMIITGYVTALSFQKRNIASLFESWSVPIAMPKILRFIIPFIMIFIVELPTIKKTSGIVGIIEQMFGGGRTRFLLYTNHDTTGFYLSDCIFSDKKV